MVVPDDETAIAAAIATLADAGHRLILTTGGTGLTPTDVTPAATLRVADREVPGIAEMMRPPAWPPPHGLAVRGVVAARRAALIVNLPGSRRAPSSR